MAKIPTILESGRADGKLVTTNSIFDENKSMFQSELNDIQDTLTSDNSNKPLSAKQGKILKELLDSKVIEAGSVPIDTTPIEGNITHLVNSDGLAKEFNKHNTAIINGSIYDISFYNNGAVFESLLALLSSADLDTLIPISVRHGGMSIRFIQGSVPNSNNKYVQYRLMNNSFSTTETDWQGVDTELSLNSKNLIESGAVKYEELRQTFNMADFFNIPKYIRPSDHQPIDTDNYRCTDYIKVKQGDVIGYRLTTNDSCGICLYSDKSFNSYVSTLVEDGLNRTEGTVTISQDGYVLCCTMYGDIDNGYIYFVGSVSEKIVKLRKADKDLQENIDEQITSLGESVNEQFNTDGLLIANSLKRNNIGSSDFTRDVYIRPSDGYLPPSTITKCTGFIPVVAGDVIKYRLFAKGSLTTICALYSEANATKFVSKLLTVPNEGLYKGTITIPSNGYVVVQNNITYTSPYIAFKDVLDDKLDVLNSEFKKITTHHINSPMVCVFHDNYSRTMQNWEIGQNSAAESTQNTYSDVNDLSKYDDGLRVDDGATFVVNSSRNSTFSLRKLNVSVDDDFVIETNAPSIVNGRVCFGFDVINILNFTLLYVQEESSNSYLVILQQIINGSFGDVIANAHIYEAKAEVLSLCFIGSDIFIKFDDTISAVMNRPIGMGKDIHIAAYKNVQTHFDFVNVFNYSYERTFNPNYLLDSGISEIPAITTSANNGGYELENTNVHYEGYAEKFHLTPNDPEIYHGIRAERSVASLIDSNLRHFKVEFDVFVSSTDIEDNLGDIMCQMHDRDGSVARSKVPFFLRYQNGKLRLNIYSTHAPQATTFITGLKDFEVCSIEKDTWVHVEFEIKERYEKSQHPLTVIKVNGKVCYVSHEANCFNDIVPSGLQYGIYKNASEWGIGVTERNRYFDNLIISYL